MRLNLRQTKPFLLGAIYFLLSQTLFHTTHAFSFTNEKHATTYHHGGIGTEHPTCSKIGKECMEEGGNAIDSAIASLLCVGVINSFSAGIGGGGLMIIKFPNSTSITIDFRETAPAKASKHMFDKLPIEASRIGPLSVAVPGELKGIHLAHAKYGKLPWKRLFRDSIALARDGFQVTPELAKYLVKNEPRIILNDEFRKIFAPNGILLKEGDVAKRTEYADTLEKISNEGPDVFYNGSIAKKIANYVKEHGGILEYEDLRDYAAIERSSIEFTYKDKYKVYTLPPPASGAVLAQILNVVEGFDFSKEKMTGSTYHRYVEALKWGYASRTKLGDPKENEDIIIHNVAKFTSKSFAGEIFKNISDTRTFPPEYYGIEISPQQDHGTTHVSVIDSYGYAVAVTSTVNLIWGSWMMVPDTGIILNDEMDDFSIPKRKNAFGLPPSPLNFISPGKRPFSSSAGTIIESITKKSPLLNMIVGVIADKTQREENFLMAIGASGGSRIISSVAQTILSVIDFEMGIEKAIESGRYHHQLIPNELEVETNISKKIIDDLKKKGHQITPIPTGILMSAVHGVVKRGNEIEAHGDSRKHGAGDGF